MIINISADGLVSWIKSKNWSAHGVAVLAVAAATAVTTDQQVRDFILQLFRDHPAIGADIIAAGGIILKYSHSSSAAGKVASAENILAAPNPPSMEEVSAANPIKPVSNPAQTKEIK